MFRNFSVLYARPFPLGRSSIQSPVFGHIHQHYYPVATPKSHDRPSSPQNAAEGKSRLFCRDGYFHRQKDGVAR